MKNKKKSGKSAPLEYDAAGVPIGETEQPVSDKTVFQSYKELEQLSRELTEDDRR